MVEPDLGAMLSILVTQEAKAGGSQVQAGLEMSLAAELLPST